MLSKFIYRFLTVVLLALVTQVGFSQNYVDVDEASEILQNAIDQLDDVIDDEPAYNGSLQALVNNNDKLDLQLMKTVQREIAIEKAVKPVMDAWYEKADAQGPDRKTKLILALDKVKELLS